MWVYAYSGLTSRCITLAHAYYLVKKYGGGVALNVIWPLEEACGISYHDVFSEDMFSDIKVNVIELEQYWIKYGAIIENLRKRDFTALAKSCINRLKIHIASFPVYVLRAFFKLKKTYFNYNPPRGIGWHDESFKEYGKNTWERLKRSASNIDSIFIYAYQKIILDDEEKEVDYNEIRFKKEYRNAVGQIMKGRTHWIGVHIRRTDNSASIEGSKTEDFIRCMKEICKTRDDVSFFLATDDPWEEQNLKEIFGDRIVTQENKKWGRETKDAMQAGIIDCLCLSSCEYVLGSYWSTFSSFAARYGKKDLRICSDKSQKPIDTAQRQSVYFF